MPCGGTSRRVRFEREVEGLRLWSAQEDCRLTTDFAVALKPVASGADIAPERLHALFVNGELLRRLSSAKPSVVFLKLAVGKQEVLGAWLCESVERAWLFGGRARGKAGGRVNALWRVTGNRSKASESRRKFLARVLAGITSLHGSC